MTKLKVIAFIAAVVGWFVLSGIAVVIDSHRLAEWLDSHLGRMLEG